MKKYILMSLAAAGLTLTSCSDEFLQKDSLTSVSAGTFWQSETDALNGLAACYDGLQNIDLYNASPWENGIFYWDCMTDNGGHFNWSGWMEGYEITNGIHSATSWACGDLWKASYEVIKRCNTLIDNIDRCGLDAATTKIYLAEATVIRSLMYMNLTMTFNDVPYFDHSQSLDEAEAPKMSREEIVPKVMADLKAAAEALPKDEAARGRISKGAALAALGRIALYNEKWSDAIDAYKQVIALNKYTLFNDYSKLFTEENEGCSEIILAVRYEGPGQSEGATFPAHWNTPLEAVNGTIDFADAFYKLDGTPYTDDKVFTNADNKYTNGWDVYTERYADRDPRLYTTLFVPGYCYWNGKGGASNLYGGAAASYSTIYVNKYYNSFDTANSWDSGQDFYVFRYAEILLGLAEAYVESGSNLDQAIALVDQVRARVNMPSVEDVEKATSQADIREVVRHERRVELGFEGLRLMDLYRWHMLKDAVDRINGEAEKYGLWYEYRNYRGEMEYEWPIPQREIDCNSNLEQNPLWK